MTKILIVKTSSLGDVVHMLPAIYDLVHADKTSLSSSHKTLQIDWVVEEAFQEVPSWSPHINRVIPIAIRRWRKSLFLLKTWQEIRQFKRNLQSVQYDYVIDPQGLLKSAIVASWANTVNSSLWGYNKNSIREPMASHFYTHKIQVSRQQHAIQRNRLLLANIFNYRLDNKPLNYGIIEQAKKLSNISNSVNSAAIDLKYKPYIMALHGTSKVEKEWSTHAWLALLKHMKKEGFSVVFPWGNAAEKQRVEYLISRADNAIMLPRCCLSELLSIILHAEAVIGMDTGLMHIAAALNKQGLALYPVTEVKLTGVLTGSDYNRIKNIAGVACEDIDAVIYKMRQLLTK
jgi:heptosyltransferase-1